MRCRASLSSRAVSGLDAYQRGDFSVAIAAS